MTRLERLLRDAELGEEPFCYGCCDWGTVRAPWPWPLFGRRWVRCPECNPGRMSRLRSRIRWVLDQPWGTTTVALFLAAAGILTTTLGVAAVAFLAQYRTVVPVLTGIEMVGTALGVGAAVAGFACRRRMVRAQMEIEADESPF